MRKAANRKEIGRKELEKMFKRHGYDDYKWIDPKRIVVAQWARMKCMFGCKNYGRCGTCPPNTPSVPECEAFFKGYKAGVKLEREVFLSGFYKAFLLFMDSCHLCAECPGIRQLCKNPKMARPSPESMAMDVFATVRKIGYPIDVLYDYSQEMNRYAFLLIE
jgi:predicted metal-binding protein